MLSSPALAADLTKIDRRIAREPAYQAQSPKYCLLVFGPEARTKVWLVIDGATLYADTNANGNLTEKGNRFPQAFPDDNDYHACKIGDIMEANGKAKHTDLQVARGQGGKDYFSVSVVAASANEQLAPMYGVAFPEFADKPETAPIVHFGAPMTLGLSIATCADRPAGICAHIGTPGLGNGSFADYTLDVLQRTQARPDLEIEYPDDKGKTPTVSPSGLVQEKAKLAWVF